MCNHRLQLWQWRCVLMQMCIWVYSKCLCLFLLSFCVGRLERVSAEIGQFNVALTARSLQSGTAEPARLLVQTPGARIRQRVQRQVRKRHPRGCLWDVRFGFQRRDATPTPPRFVLLHFAVVEFDDGERERIHRWRDDGACFPLARLLVSLIYARNRVGARLALRKQAVFSRTRRATVVSRRFIALRLHVADEAVERNAVFWAQTVDVDNCGVNVSQIDDFGFLIAILMENRVSTDEQENPDSHH